MRLSHLDLHVNFRPLSQILIRIIHRIREKIRKSACECLLSAKLFLKTPLSLCFLAVTPPAQRVQFILGEDQNDPAHEPHPLFSEMEELLLDEDGELEWKETAR